jgi:hypothetical protein
MPSPSPDEEGTDIEPARLVELVDATDREISLDQPDTDIEERRTGRMPSVHD